jgi:hypothetical protein
MRHASAEMSSGGIFSHLIGGIDAIGSVLIVQFTFLFIRKRGVRFGYFLEIFGRLCVAWILIRMPL